MPRKSSRRRSRSRRSRRRRRAGALFGKKAVCPRASCM